MTVEQIMEVITDCREHGLEQAYLTMPTPQFRSRYPLRVRTPFGLCRWYPSADPARIIIYPTVKQLTKYLRRAVLEPKGGRS